MLDFRFMLVGCVHACAALQRRLPRVGAWIDCPWVVGFSTFPAAARTATSFASEPVAGLVGTVLSAIRG